jgi:ABC-type cobalt transport system substrate-binding protein
VLTLSPPLNEAKIGGFGGLQFLEKGDKDIAASPPYKPFCAKFYGKPNGEIRNVLASIVFKLFNKN